MFVHLLKGKIINISKKTLQFSNPNVVTKEVNQSIPIAPDGKELLISWDDVKNELKFDYKDIEIEHPEPAEPILDEPTSKTVEEKLSKLEQDLKAQKQQNLILMDINLTIYEELLTIQERLNNAEQNGGV